MIAFRVKNSKTEMRENDKNRLCGAETGLSTEGYYKGFSRI